MKIIIFILLLSAFCIPLFGQDNSPHPIPLKEPEKSWQLPRLLYSQRIGNNYISKGMCTCPHARTQSTAEISWYGLFFNVWSNWDLTGYAKDPKGRPYHRDAVEWDYTLGYGHIIARDLPVLKDLKATVSYCYAEIPRNSSGNSENYAILLGASCLLKPQVRFQWYPKGYDQFRLRFSFSHDVPFLESYNWKNNFTIWTGNSRLLGAACPGGWRVAKQKKENGERGGDTYKTGIYSFVYTTEIEYEISKNIKFSPFIQAAWAPDHDVREGWEDRKASSALNFGYGATLKFLF